MGTSNNFMKEYEELMEDFEGVKKELTSAETTKNLLKENYQEEKEKLNKEYGITFGNIKELQELKDNTEEEVKGILEHMREKLDGLDTNNKVDLDDLESDLDGLDI